MCGKGTSLNLSLHLPFCVSVPSFVEWEAQCLSYRAITHVRSHVCQDPDLDARRSLDSQCMASWPRGLEAHKSPYCVAVSVSSLGICFFFSGISPST